MRYNKIVTLALIATVFAACRTKPEVTALSISPDAGTRYKLGDEIAVKAIIPSTIKADSIVYLIDSVRVTSRKDTAAAKLKTDSLKLGDKLITARVFSGGKAQEVSTNILLLAAKPPEELTYVVDKVFPHDTSSYTEGLLYQDGVLYESSGGYLNPPPGTPKDQQSSLRKVDLNTGKVIKKIMVDPSVFAEGISIVGDKLIQLTYHEKKAFIYNKNTFELLSTINYTWGKEGWGMCFDGKTVYNNDSTNRIFMLNKDTFQPYSFIDVYDDQHDIQMVNEMEYIDGKIYANIYTTDSIIVINPKNGAVLQIINLANLYPKDTRNPNADVLNGIAWDEKGKRMFITGKKWPHLYQVRFVKK